MSHESFYGISKPLSSSIVACPSSGLPTCGSILSVLGPPGHSKVVADVGYSDDDARDDEHSDKASIDVVGPPSVLPWACSIDVAGPPLVLPGAGSIDAVGPPSLLPGACSIDVAGPPLVLPGAGSTGRAGSTDTPWPSATSLFWRLLVGLTFRKHSACSCKCGLFLLPISLVLLTLSAACEFTQTNTHV